MLVPRDRKRGPILTLGTPYNRRSLILTGRVEKGNWPEEPYPTPESLPFPEDPVPDEPDPEPAPDPDDDSGDPDGPDGGPDPLPGPEYSSGSPPLPLDLLLASSHGTLGGLVGQAITGIVQAISALQNIQAAYAPFMPPAQAPAQLFQPLRSPLSQPEQLPLQSLPPAPSPVSRSIRETPAYQTLNRIREAQYQRMESQAERRSLPDGRPAARGVAEAYMPGPVRDFHAGGADPTGQTRASTANIAPFEPFQSASAGLAPQEAFRQLFNPSGGLGLSFVQEDPRWIQENLSHAAQPLTLEDQLRMQQARQQADTQQQTQLAAAQAQREMYQAQTRMLRERQQQVQEQNYGFRGWKAAPMAIPASGEQATGPKSQLPPKPLVFRDDVDLSKLLWQHFLTGEGQPLEIDLSRLDFSKNINAPRLLSSGGQLLLNPKIDARALQQAFHKKLTVAGNGKVTHVLFNEPLDVLLNIPESDPKYAGLGRVRVNMNAVEILVNHQTRAVTVVAELGPSSEGIKNKNLFDKFDFNPDKLGGRRPEAEMATRLVHRYAPPGSISYKIFARPGNPSKFKRTYTFEEFFGRIHSRP